MGSMGEDCCVACVVQGSGLKVRVSGLRVQDSGLGSKRKSSGSGDWRAGSGSAVVLHLEQLSVFRVQDLGFGG